MGYFNNNWLKSAVLALGSVSAATASAEPNDYHPENYQQPQNYNKPQAANRYQQYGVQLQYANQQRLTQPQRASYRQPVQYQYRQNVNLPPEIEPYQENQQWQQAPRTIRRQPVATVPAMRYTERVMPAPQRMQQYQQQQRRPAISSDRMALVQAAYRALGTTYVWGGNTPSQGFDCSGLTKYTHKNAHLQIPRTAREQSQASRTIRRQDLKPGDMIFFRTSGKTVNHVGIYVGDGKMIHAATGSRKVRLDDLRKSYWQNRLVKYGTFLT